MFQWVNHPFGEVLAVEVVCLHKCEFPVRLFEDTQKAICVLNELGFDKRPDKTNMGMEQRGGLTSV
jgi:hypothetical protein